MNEKIKSQVKEILTVSSEVQLNELRELIKIGDVSESQKEVYLHLLTDFENFPNDDESLTETTKLYLTIFTETEFEEFYKMSVSEIGKKSARNQMMLSRGIQELLLKFSSTLREINGIQ